ncbi:ribonuclease III domain-containing protein [Phaeosphaeria sp. MPI-PUGE-AT-0046c]|nr:ribonuclease III domain-containing protein [Phaeosphaeria sp. MPI-PUGE-AT-0046c]
MASQKRGNSSSHYSDRNQYTHKKQRPNQHLYNSAAYDDRNRNHHGAHDIIPDQPQLSATELQTGLVALLDRFVAAEMTPQADKDILLHARELRRLVSTRNTKSVSAQAKLDLDQKRPDKVANVAVPDYIYRTVVASKDLPPLPPITEPHLHQAVFTHRSVHATSINVHEYVDLGLDYERLEFLGDAYIELIASRALYNRFPLVEVPQLCSWRERLVENIALAKFSEAYGFPDRLQYKVDFDKTSKAWNKVVADIFEAYVAGVVLSDPENGFAVAEKWLDELWAPQLLGFKEKIVENPRARDDLQKLILVNGIELKFREERPLVVDRGVHSYAMGAYLTGWGYENEWLGSGEGQKKAAACIAAATHALKMNSEVLQNAARQKKELVEARAKEREEQEETEAAKVGQGEDGEAAPVAPEAMDTIPQTFDSAKKRKTDDAKDDSEKKSKKHKKGKKDKKEKEEME